MQSIETSGRRLIWTYSVSVFGCLVFVLETAEKRRSVVFRFNAPRFVSHVSMPRGRSEIAKMVVRIVISGVG